MGGLVVMALWLDVFLLPYFLLHVCCEEGNGAGVGEGSEGQKWTRL